MFICPISNAVQFLLEILALLFSTSVQHVIVQANGGSTNTATVTLHFHFYYLLNIIK